MFAVSSNKKIGKSNEGVSSSFKRKGHFTEHVIKLWGSFSQGVGGYWKFTSQQKAIGKFLKQTSIKANTELPHLNHIRPNASGGSNEKISYKLLIFLSSFLGILYYLYSQKGHVALWVIIIVPTLGRGVIILKDFVSVLETFFC